MNDDILKNPAYQPLTDQQLARIDELCDRFDRELANGRGPRIEALEIGVQNGPTSAPKMDPP